MCDSPRGTIIYLVWDVGVFSKSGVHPKIVVQKIDIWWIKDISFDVLRYFIVNTIIKHLIEVYLITKRYTEASCMENWKIARLYFSAVDITHWLSLSVFVMTVVGFYEKRCFLLNSINIYKKLITVVYFLLQLTRRTALKSSNLVKEQTVCTKSDLTTCLLLTCFVTKQQPVGGGQSSKRDSTDPLISSLIGVITNMDLVTWMESFGLVMIRFTAWPQIVITHCEWTWKILGGTLNMPSTTCSVLWVRMTNTNWSSAVTQVWSVFLFLHRESTEISILMKREYERERRRKFLTQETELS